MVSGQPSASAYENVAVQGKGKEVSNLEQLSGFIFICSGETKPECYEYRVFGLPRGKKEVVERIKLGMKLFLFDFEKKLLYGIYEASSGGRLNLEPCAFGGRFPAQVKFKIYKDCYPLPEKSFRPAIQDNYQNGTKFKQELSDHQVRSLLTLFRSFTSALLQHMHPRLLDVNRPGAMQFLGVGNQFQPQAWVSSSKDQYRAERQLNHALPASETQQVLMREPQNDFYRRALTRGHASSMVELQQAPSPRLPYFVARSVSPLQHPYNGMTGHTRTPIEPQAMQNMNEQLFSGIQPPLVQGGLLQPMRSPYHNNSSTPSDFQGYGGEHETGRARYYPVKLQMDRETVQQQENFAAYDNSHLVTAAPFIHQSLQPYTTTVPYISQSIQPHTFRLGHASQSLKSESSVQRTSGPISPYVSYP